jgi:hypothetical protein
MPVNSREKLEHVTVPVAVDITFALLGTANAISNITDSDAGRIKLAGTKRAISRFIGGISGSLFSGNSWLIRASARFHPLHGSVNRAQGSFTQASYHNCDYE